MSSLVAERYDDIVVDDTYKHDSISSGITIISSSEGGGEVKDRKQQQKRIRNSNNNNTSSKKQQQKERIFSGMNLIVSNKVFIVLISLIGFTILMSFIIAFAVLDTHDSFHRTDTIISIQDLKHIFQQKIDSLRLLRHRNNSTGSNSLSINTIKKDDTTTTKTSLSFVPYEPPFVEIPNGKQLSDDVLNGHNPTIGGIIYILQMFLRDLRISNKQLQNVPNNRTGQDMVRFSYMKLVQKHLVPFDSMYRHRTIFPVRTHDESIFISLAAYREHLLYETLVGAFGQAKFPQHIYAGIVLQNCFGIDDITHEQYECFTGVQVVGTNANGQPITKVSKSDPDINGVIKFCNDTTYKQYCDNGQIRVLYVHESESLGPAIARYYASKLWGGETYFLQVDSHLEFTLDWDDNYIQEIKSTMNYPKSILSMYPPGFGHLAGVTPGTRLCSCEFSPHDIEDHIIRINNGIGYSHSDTINLQHPTQIPFIAAGFFFTRGEFLQDVPFDPYLPWAFMGEEIALSMRAWTSGWNIYAPRKNWIAHQYRPGRMGLPKFWETVGRTFHRSIQFSNLLQSQIINRIKYITGYPEITQQSLIDTNLVDVLNDIQYYGLGTNRTQDDYAQFTGINFHTKQCPNIQWCNQGTKT